MHNAISSPDITTGDRYIARNIVANRAGMVAMTGFDQQTEEEVFVKSRIPELDANAAMRISREADILASLQHPQIPTLIDADPNAEMPYIVTELKDQHPNVSEGFRLNSNPTFAAELCIAALEPLAYAHEKGYTHRDIKPANFLMTWTGDVVVADWEIALCRDSELAKNTYKDSKYNDWRITQVGKVWGSAGYMSPEQRQGRTRVQDGRSDLYSVGVVLHLFLEGKLPIVDENPNEKVVREMMGSTRSYLPGRPVPTVLRDITERALQEEPDDRYQSATEMSEDLERYLSVA